MRMYCLPLGVGDAESPNSASTPILVILSYVFNFGTIMSRKGVLLIGTFLLSGCGEVKVVDNDSSAITKVNPVNEIVEIRKNVPSVSQLECLQLASPSFKFDNALTDGDRDVFARATRAHLAPLNYQIKNPCANTFRLNVLEYKVQEIVIASRVIVDLEGEIQDATGLTLWNASYRLTESAGSVPFDPISIGIGAVSAANNSSEDNRHNAVYLAVRRLLMALPENLNLSAQGEFAQTVKPEASDQPTINDALELWERDERDKALSLAQSVYESDDKASVGYRYGLLLEASERDSDAASVYSETAIAQLESSLYDDALRTLRRLDRLNQTNSGQFDLELNRALEFVKQK